MSTPLSAIRLSLVLAAVVAASLAAAPAAFGEGVLRPEGSAESPVFEPEAGKANQLTVTATRFSLTISDSADTIEAAIPGCTGTGTNTLECSGEFFRVSVFLDLFGESFADTLVGSGSVVVSALGGGGNDTITANGAVPFEGSGGEGNDTLNGGSGGDQLEGGEGVDSVNGNAGNDILRGGEGSGDVVSGGAGNDVFLGVFSDGVDLLNGGSGVDGIFYLTTDTEAPPPDYQVDLGAGIISSGGETDTFTSVEDAITFQGADTVIGSAGANRINTATDEEFLLFVLSGAGSLQVDAGDTVDPKGGPDFVTTGANNDIVDLVDGTADRLDCGPGTDIVDADQVDVLVNCENVDRTTLASDDDPDSPDPPPPPASDVTLPVCGLQGIAPRYRRKAFLRGVGGSISCNEPVTLEVRLTTPARAPRKSRKARRNKRHGQRATASRAGDLMLVETTAPLAFGRSLRLRPIPRLRPFLGPSFRATLQIVARDLAGNATVLQRVIRVLPDRKKGKKKGKRGKRAGNR